ncbi:hypothetical protein KAJ83_04495 [Marivibrio halodurans]|uniref:Uncharacterized protein n=2 Tax=Marivibrio halodurans TaxID=2039722 RepID=A0A8J7V1X0_9PROT|nr:hypothetical protein [Marivibrio halodurans]MBP5856257.1 hypothetical protein [Marivibrio halodurans]
MTSFAKNLSPTPITADSPRPDFGTAGQAEPDKASHRASDMVKKGRPEPALKPSPALSHEVDGTAFDAAWKDEAKAARRDAFKAKRRAQAAQSKSRAFKRAVTR